MKKTCALAVCFAIAGCGEASLDPPYGRQSIPDEPPPAHGVAITDVAAFQVVKASLLARNAPVVAERAAVVRVYVSPAAEVIGAPLTATLAIDDAMWTDAKTLARASSDADLASTFDFAVPPAAITPGATFAVTIADARGDVVARFPADGSRASLGAQATPPLRVTLAPMRYTADGSGRLPDTSASQVARIRDALFARYPVPSVAIDVREPSTFDGAVDAGGGGWPDALAAIVALRASDAAPDDAYYVGLVAPAASESAYCGARCLHGLSPIADDPADARARASVVTGFTGGDAALAAVHEIGHAHGRRHAPCGGAENVDVAYPYERGAIGAWGYDAATDRWIDATTFKDMMSYCAPGFASDYTFRALFDRARAITEPRGAAPLARAYDYGDLPGTIDVSP
jgi:hypothetical protein